MHIIHQIIKRLKLIAAFETFLPPDQPCSSFLPFWNKYVSTTTSHAPEYRQKDGSKDQKPRPDVSIFAAPEKKPRIAENGSPIKPSEINKTDPADGQGLIPPRHRARRTWIFDTLVHRLPEERRDTDSHEARKAETKRKAARSQEVENLLITLSSIRSKARQCECDAEVVDRLILNFLALSKHLGVTADEHQKALDMTHACMHIVVHVRAVTKLVEDVVAALREDDKVLDFNSAYAQMRGPLEGAGTMVLAGEKLMKEVGGLQGVKRAVVGKKFKEVEERASEMIGAIEKVWVQDGI